MVLSVRVSLFIPKYFGINVGEATISIGTFAVPHDAAGTGSDIDSVPGCSTDVFFAPLMRNVTVTPLSMYGLTEGT